MNDEDYLKQAGITDSGDEAIAEAAPQAAEGAPVAPQTPTEMFEIGQHKFPVNTEFKLTHDGKVAKVPYSTMVNTYRQWSHLQNKWTNEYKPKIDEFEKLRPEYEKYKTAYDKTGAIHEWSIQNPDKWKTLEDIWLNKDRHLLEAKTTQPGFENSQIGGAGNSAHLKPFIDEITALKQELNGFKEFKTNFEKEQETKQQQKDTEFVLSEKDTFQKEYPEINLEERDPDGLALWAKIMKFGIDSRLPDFETAALKYLKPRLIDTWSSRARNEAVKGIKNDKQQGIIKRSVTPINGQAQESKVDPRKMSLGQLAEYAKNNIEAFSA